MPRHSSNPPRREEDRGGGGQSRREEGSSEYGRPGAALAVHLIVTMTNEKSAKPVVRGKG